MSFKFYPLNWLKRRTFWQVACSLILMTFLPVFSQRTTVNSNYFNHSLTDSESNLTPVNRD